MKNLFSGDSEAPQYILGILGTLPVLVCLYLILPERGDPFDLSGLENVIDSDKELNRLYHLPSKAYCSLGSPPIICAHGGDVSVAPPNTIESFERAIEAGCNCLEIDVSMTLDGHLVALHDRNLQVLQGTRKQKSGVFSIFGRTNKNSSISQASLQDLKKLRWQDGSEISELGQILNLAKKSSMEVIIDVKLPRHLIGEEFGRKMLKMLVHEIHHYQYQRSALVWAKDDTVLMHTLEIDRSIRIGIISVNETINDFLHERHRIDRLQGLYNIEAVGVHYDMVTPSLIQHANTLGRDVYVWTATTAGMMSTALDAGPRVVVTGRPRLLLNAISHRAVACHVQSLLK